MLDPIEEEKYRRLHDMCRELKLPTLPELFLTFKNEDSKGRVLLDDTVRGHSWTRNFYNWMTAAGLDTPGDGVTASFGAGYLGAKDTYGTVKSSTATCALRNSNTILNNGFHDAATTGYFGIHVGTGTTAFSIDNYMLEAKIVPGNSAGRLLYSAQAVPVTAYVSTAGEEKWTTTITRIFNNNSGDSITVNEVGLVVRHNIWGDSYYLFERSVLSSPVTVVNGGQLTISYLLSMDYSTID